MTLGRFTIQLMADGDVPKERFLEPSGLAHALNTFVIAPNTSMIVQANGLTVTQAWPTDKIDESIVTVATYSYRSPETQQERDLVKVCCCVCAVSVLWRNGRAVHRHTHCGATIVLGSEPRCSRCRTAAHCRCCRSLPTRRH